MQQFNSYSPKLLATHLENHGFKIKEVKTSFIKPVPHVAMQAAIDNKSFSERDLEFFYKLSTVLPDFGSEIFGIAVK